MAGPWEKYKINQVQSGPWNKYSTAKQSSMQAPAQEQAKQTPYSELEKNLGQRTDKIGETIKRNAFAEISPAEAAYVTMGQLAGGVGDTIGYGLSSADYALGNIPSGIVKGAANAFGSLPSAGGGTVGEGLAQYAKGVAERYGQLKQENPRGADVAEATGNILSVVPMGKLSPTKAVGGSIYDAGVAKARKPIQRLVQEPLDKAARAKASLEGRLTQKLIGEDIVALTRTEQRAVPLVENIKGINSILPKSMTKKGNIIRQEANNIADKVYKDLGKYNNYKLKPDYIDQELIGQIKQKFYDQRELIKGGGIDFKASVDEILGALDDEIKKNPNTLQGLLQARRDFNTYVQRKGGNLSPEAKGVANRISREIGNDVNDFIAKHVPDEKVRDRLLDSHSLYVASENVADKVAAQADSGLKRIITKIEENVPLKNELAKLAGLGGLGYLATQSAPITLGLSGMYIGGKVLNSASTKKMIGSILKDGSNFVDAEARNALLDYMDQLEQNQKNNIDSTLKMSPEEYKKRFK